MAPYHTEENVSPVVEAISPIRAATLKHAIRSLKWKDLPLQVSGISTEIFKQIETVENDHDASTAAALEAVERRGEMVVRVIEPRQMGRQASEAAKKFIAMQVCYR